MHSPGWLNKYPDTNLYQIVLSIACTLVFFMWLAVFLGQESKFEATIMALLMFASGLLTVYLIFRRRWLLREMIAGKKVAEEPPLERTAVELSAREIDESERLLRSALWK